MDGRALGLMAELAILVVDDEAPARQRLKRLLDGLPGAYLCGEASSASTALDACRQQSPDVVLLDINLAESNGLVLARELRNLDPAPAVIFVTAHEAHAVEAFDLAALDYLVKPVRPERLARALARVQPTAPKGSRSADPAPLALTVKLGEETRSLPLDSIRACLAEDKYTRALAIDGEALLEESLVTLEQRYPGRFLRIHRKALVARGHLKALKRGADGHDVLMVDDLDIELPVARRRLAEVRQALSFRLPG